MERNANSILSALLFWAIFICSLLSNKIEFICGLLNAGVQHGRRILAEVWIEW